MQIIMTQIIMTASAVKMAGQLNLSRNRRKKLLCCGIAYRLEFVLRLIDNLHSVYPMIAGVTHPPSALYSPPVFLGKFVRWLIPTCVLSSGSAYNALRQELRYHAEDLVAATKTIIRTIARTINNGIQIGLKTHHQDHVILPSNLRVIKTMANSPVNPISPLWLDFSLILRSVLVKEFNNPVAELFIAPHYHGLEDYIIIPDVINRISDLVLG